MFYNEKKIHYKIYFVVDKIIIFAIINKMF